MDILAHCANGHPRGNDDKPWCGCGAPRFEIGRVTGTQADMVREIRALREQLAGAVEAIATLREALSYYATEPSQWGPSGRRANAALNATAEWKR